MPYAPSPMELCERMLGSMLCEVEVDADEQVVYIHTSTGMIKIAGEELSMYVECDDYVN